MTENGVVCLNGLTFIFELYGLQYFSLKTSAGENFKNGISLFRKIYFLIFFAVAIVISFFSITDATPYQAVIVKNVLVVLYQQSISYFFFFSILSNYFEAFVTTSRNQKFFKNSMEIADSCFCNFKVEINFKEFRRKAWRRFLGIALLFVSCQIAMFALNDGGELSSIFIAMFVPLFYESFSLMIVAKFCFNVGLVNFQLNHVHKLLKMVSESQLESFGLKVNFLSQADLRSQKQLTDLQKIWKIYSKVCENGSLVNKSLGVSMLLIMVNLVMGLAHSGYEISVALMGGSTSITVIGMLVLC